MEHMRLSESELRASFLSRLLPRDPRYSQPTVPGWCLEDNVIVNSSWFELRGNLYLDF